VHAVERLLDGFQLLEDFLQFGWLIDFPVFLRRKANPCAVGATALCTLAGWAMAPRFDIVNIAMVYLLAGVLIALFFTRGAAIASAMLCVAAFDFMFVPGATPK
jgi:K+-sensing histidine kinase KdpD